VNCGALIDYHAQLRGSIYLTLTFTFRKQSIASGRSMAKPVRAGQLQKLRVRSLPRAVLQRHFETRQFSVLNRPPPNYEGHIPLTVAERLGLALGSGLGSFLDPRRGGIHVFQPSDQWIATDTPRSHRILRRSHCATLFHIQASGTDASKSHRTSYTARSTATYVKITQCCAPPRAATEHAGLCICRMAGSRRRLTRYESAREIHR
jgi:hypothetical protein